MKLRNEEKKTKEFCMSREIDNNFGNLKKNNINVKEQKMKKLLFVILIMICLVGMLSAQVPPSISVLRTTDNSVITPSLTPTGLPTHWPIIDIGEVEVVEVSPGQFEVDIDPIVVRVRNNTDNAISLSANMWDASGFFTSAHEYFQVATPGPLNVAPNNTRDFTVNFIPFLNDPVIGEYMAFVRFSSPEFYVFLQAEVTDVVNYNFPESAALHFVNQWGAWVPMQLSMVGAQLSQTLYLGTEINATTNFAGRGISYLRYRFRSVGNVTEDQKVQIFINHTATGTVTASTWPVNVINTSCVSEGGNKVFDGYIELDGLPAGDHDVIIPLPHPFLYAGGHIVISIYREGGAAAPNAGNMWEGMTDTGADRTAYSISGTAINFANIGAASTTTTGGIAAVEIYFEPAVQVAQLLHFPAGATGAHLPFANNVVTSHNFHHVGIETGQTASTVFALRNIGVAAAGQPLVVRNITTAGGNHGSFRVQPVSLPHTFTGFMFFDVTFDPNRVGNFWTDLYITYDGMEEPLVVRLTGQGVDFPSAPTTATVGTGFLDPRAAFTQYTAPHPMNFTAAHSISQTIILADEIGAAQRTGYFITHLRYRLRTVGEINPADMVRVWIQSTAKNDFTDGTDLSFDPITRPANPNFEGNLSMSNRGDYYVTIELDEPFMYSGAGSIMITVIRAGTIATTPTGHLWHTRTIGTNVAADRRALAHTNATAFNPANLGTLALTANNTPASVQLFFSSPEGVAVIEHGRRSHNFGSVIVSDIDDFTETPATTIFSLRNVGEADLIGDYDIESFEIMPPELRETFVVGTIGRSIAPGERRTIPVTFMPQTAGDFTARLVFQTQAYVGATPITHRIPLFGRGIALSDDAVFTQIVSEDDEWGGDENDYLAIGPFNLGINSSKAEALYLANEIGADRIGHEITHVRYRLKNAGNVTADDIAVRMWIRHDSESTIAGLSPNFHNATLVFCNDCESCEANKLLVQSHGEYTVTIALCNPFIYLGGNIRIITIRKLELDAAKLFANNLWQMHNTGTNRFTHTFNNTHDQENYFGSSPIGGISQNVPAVQLFFAPKPATFAINVADGFDFGIVGTGENTVTRFDIHTAGYGSLEIYRIRFTGAEAGRFNVFRTPGEAATGNHLPQSPGNGEIRPGNPLIVNRGTGAPEVVSVYVRFVPGTTVPAQPRFHVNMVFETNCEEDFDSYGELKVPCLTDGIHTVRIDAEIRALPQFNQAVFGAILPQMLVTDAIDDDNFAGFTDGEFSAGTPIDFINRGFASRMVFRSVEDLGMTTVADWHGRELEYLRFRFSSVGDVRADIPVRIYIQQVEASTAPADVVFEEDDLVFASYLPVNSAGFYNVTIPLKKPFVYEYTASPAKPDIAIMIVREFDANNAELQIFNAGNTWFRPAGGATSAATRSLVAGADYFDNASWTATQALPAIQMFFSPPTYDFVAVRESHDFNRVGIHTGASRDVSTARLRVNNEGYASMTIQSVVLYGNDGNPIVDSPTAILRRTEPISLPVTIAGRSGATVRGTDFTVRFAPIAVGPLNARMVFYGAGNVVLGEIALTGQGISFPAPITFRTIGEEHPVTAGIAIPGNFHDHDKIDDSDDLSDEVPFDLSKRNSFSQSIYLGTELNINAQEIRFIRYRVFVDHDDPDKIITRRIPIRVWIGHTTETEFDDNEDWIPVSEQTLVYNDYLDVTNDGSYIVTLELNPPFLYLGENRNIVITTNRVLEGDNAEQIGDISWAMHETTADRTLWRSADTYISTADAGTDTSEVDTRPSIEFYFGQNVARLVAIPSSYDFNKVSIGTSGNHLIGTVANLAVRNPATVDVSNAILDFVTALGGSELHTNPPFTLGVSTIDFVPRGETRVIPVTFNPTVAGPESSFLRIRSNAPTIYIPIRGEGYNFGTGVVFGHNTDLIDWDYFDVNFDLNHPDHPDVDNWDVDKHFDNHSPFNFATRGNVSQAIYTGHGVANQNEVRYLRYALSSVGDIQEEIFVRIHMMSVEDSRFTASGGSWLNFTPGGGSNAKRVFEGMITVTPGEHFVTIKLDSPFRHVNTDSRQNIAIMTQRVYHVNNIIYSDNNRWFVYGTQPGTGFVSTVSVNRSDDTSVLNLGAFSTVGPISGGVTTVPAVQFISGPASALAVVDFDSFDFNYVGVIDDFPETDFVVSNPGNVNLTFNLATITFGRVEPAVAGAYNTVFTVTAPAAPGGSPPPFTNVDGAITLTPGNELILTVEFRPTATINGEINATMRIPTNAGDLNINLKGHGLENLPSGDFVTEVEIAPAVDPVQTVPFNLTVANSRTQTVYLEAQVDGSDLKGQGIRYLRWSFDGGEGTPAGRADFPVRIWIHGMGNSINLADDFDDKKLEDRPNFEGVIRTNSRGEYNVTVRLQRPFIYTGGNIVITTEIRNGAMYTNTAGQNTWKLAANATTGQERTRVSEFALGSFTWAAASNLIPAISFYFEAAPPRLLFEVTDASGAELGEMIYTNIDFGRVRVGATPANYSTIEVEFTNLGTDDLRLFHQLPEGVTVWKDINSPTDFDAPENNVSIGVFEIPHDEGSNENVVTLTYRYIPAAGHVNENNVTRHPLEIKILTDVETEWGRSALEELVTFDAFAIVTPSVPANTIQIGDGFHVIDQNDSATNPHGLPMALNTRHSYTQSIFLNTLAELGNARRLITEVSFLYSGNRDLIEEDVTIHMGTIAVATAAFPNTNFVDPIGNQQVFNGRITLDRRADIGEQESWVRIILDEPFLFNGTGNLVMSVRKHTAAPRQIRDFFHYVSVTGDRSLAYSHETVATSATGMPRAFIPNTRFGFEQNRNVLRIESDLFDSATPRRIDLGDFVAYEKAHADSTQTIIVRNMHSAQIQISGISFPANSDLKVLEVRRDAAVLSTWPQDIASFEYFYVDISLESTALGMIDTTNNNNILTIATVGTAVPNLEQPVIANTIAHSWLALYEEDEQETFTGTFPSPAHNIAGLPHGWYRGAAGSNTVGVVNNELELFNHTSGTFLWAATPLIAEIGRQEIVFDARVSANAVGSLIVGVMDSPLGEPGGVVSVARAINIGTGDADLTTARKRFVVSLDGFGDTSNRRVYFRFNSTAAESRLFIDNVEVKRRVTDPTAASLTAVLMTDPEVRQDGDTLTVPFGNVPLLDAETRVIRLINESNANVTVTSGTVPAPFTLEGTITGVIPAGGFRDFRINYRETTMPPPPTRDATFNVNYTGAPGSPIRINLTSRVVEANRYLVTAAYPLEPDFSGADLPRSWIVRNTTHNGKIETENDAIFMFNGSGEDNHDRDLWVSTPIIANLGHADEDIRERGVRLTFTARASENNVRLRVALLRDPYSIATLIEGSDAMAAGLSAANAVRNGFNLTNADVVYSIYFADLDDEDHDLTLNDYRIVFIHPNTRDAIQGVRISALSVEVPRVVGEAELTIFPGDFRFVSQNDDAGFTLAHLNNTGDVAINFNPTSISITPVSGATTNGAFRVTDSAGNPFVNANRTLTVDGANQQFTFRVYLDRPTALGGFNAQMTVNYTPVAGEPTSATSIPIMGTVESRNINVSPSEPAVVVSLTDERHLNLSGDLPLGWHRMVNTTTNSTVNITDGRIVMNNANTTTTFDPVLVSPIINPSTASVRAFVTARANVATGQQLILGYVSNYNTDSPAIFNTLDAKVINLTNEFQTFYFDLPELAGRRLYIRHGLGALNRTITIDEISFVAGEETINVNITANAGLSGNTLGFPTHNIGATPAPTRTLTFTNRGNTTIELMVREATGAHGSQFTHPFGTERIKLGPQGSGSNIRNLVVTFTPTLTHGQASRTAPMIVEVFNAQGDLVPSTEPNATRTLTLEGFANLATMAVLPAFDTGPPANLYVIGNVELGVTPTFVTRDITIRNTGGAPLVINSINITPTPGEFRVTAPATFPMTIPAGTVASPTDRVVTIRFEPSGTSTDVRTATMTINRTIGGVQTTFPASPAVINLRGGILTRGLAFLDEDEEQLDLLDLGNVAINAPTKETKVTLKNTGNFPIIINNIVLERVPGPINDFQFLASEWSILGIGDSATAPWRWSFEDGAEHEITVIHTPSVVGDRSAQIRIITDPPAQSRILVIRSTARATDIAFTPSPTAGINFGNVDIKGSHLNGFRDRPLHISNPSAAPLTINSIELTKMDGSDINYKDEDEDDLRVYEFAWRWSGDTEWVTSDTEIDPIPANGTRTIEIRHFAYFGEVGNRAAKLTINHNAVGYTPPPAGRSLPNLDTVFNLTSTATDVEVTAYLGSQVSSTADITWTEVTLGTPAGRIDFGTVGIGETIYPRRFVRFRNSGIGDVKTDGDLFDPIIPIGDPSQFRIEPLFDESDTLKVNESVQFEVVFNPIRDTGEVIERARYTLYITNLYETKSEGDHEIGLKKGDMVFANFRHIDIFGRVADRREIAYEVNGEDPSLFEDDIVVDFSDGRFVDVGIRTEPMIVTVKNDGIGAVWMTGVEWLGHLWLKNNEFEITYLDQDGEEIEEIPHRLAEGEHLYMSITHLALEAGFRQGMLVAYFAGDAIEFDDEEEEYVHVPGVLIEDLSQGFRLEGFAIPGRQVEFKIDGVVYNHLNEDNALIYHTQRIIPFEKEALLYIDGEPMLEGVNPIRGVYVAQEFTRTLTVTNKGEIPLELLTSVDWGVNQGTTFVIDGFGRDEDDKVIDRITLEPGEHYDFKINHTAIRVGFENSSPREPNRRYTHNATRSFWLVNPDGDTTNLNIPISFRSTAIDRRHVEIRGRNFTFEIEQEEDDMNAETSINFGNRIVGVPEIREFDIVNTGLGFVRIDYLWVNDGSGDWEQVDGIENQLLFLPQYVVDIDEKDEQFKKDGIYTIRHLRANPIPEGATLRVRVTHAPMHEGDREQRMAVIPQPGDLRDIYWIDLLSVARDERAFTVRIEDRPFLAANLLQPLNFGLNYMGQETNRRRVTVRNTRVGFIDLRDIGADLINFKVYPDNKPESKPGCEEPLHRRVMPGTSEDFYVSFTPQTTGTYNEALLFNIFDDSYDFTSKHYFTVELSGSGTEGLTFSTYPLTFRFEADDNVVVGVPHNIDVDIINANEYADNTEKDANTLEIFNLVMTDNLDEEITVHVLNEGWERWEGWESEEIGNADVEAQPFPFYLNPDVARSGRHDRRTLLIRVVADNHVGDRTAQLEVSHRKGYPGSGSLEVEPFPVIISGAQRRALTIGASENDFVFNTEPLDIYDEDLELELIIADETQKITKEFYLRNTGNLELHPAIRTNETDSEGNPIWISGFPITGGHGPDDFEIFVHHRVQLCELEEDEECEVEIEGHECYVYLDITDEFMNMENLYTIYPKHHKDFIEEFRITLVYSPKTPGHLISNLTVTATPKHPHHTDIRPVATAVVRLESNVKVPAHHLTITPSALEFGYHIYGIAAPSRTITLTNEGDVAVVINSIFNNNVAHFPVTMPTGLEFPVTIEPGDDPIVLTVGFATSGFGTGPREAILSIYNDAGLHPRTVVMTGHVTRPLFTVTPEYRDFGLFHPGDDYVEQTFTLKNEGLVPGRIISATIAGYAGFRINDPQIANQDVAVDGELTFTARFTPGPAGAREAMVTIVPQHADAITVNLSATVTALPAGYIVALPVEVQFGEALIGSLPQTRTVRVTNQGDANAVVQRPVLYPLHADFALEGIPAGVTTLIPGAHFEFTVRSTSTTAGPIGTYITIDSDGANNYGTGELIIPVRKYVIQNRIEVTPATLLVDFGRVMIGGTVAPQTVTIRNTGNRPLVLNSVVQTNATGFPVTAGLPIADLTIQPGGSRDIVVTLNVATYGLKTGELVITNSVQAPITVNLTGFVANTATTVTPNPIAFGNVIVGQAATPVTLIVRNNGNENLVISGITLGGTNLGDFSLTNAPTYPHTVVPNGTASITVNHTATAVGNRYGTVYIANNLEEPIRVNLTSTAAPALEEITVSPATISFDPVNIGQTSPTRTVTITNSGDVPVTVQVPTVTGVNAANFPLTNLPTVPQIVQPGLNIVFQVGFNATAPAEAKEATILVESSAGARQVTLTGTVTEAPTFLIQVSPPDVNFGQVLVGSNVTPRIVTISNIGNQSLNILSVVLSNETDFPTTGVPTPNHTLERGGNIPLSVGLNLANLGQRAGTITITHSAANVVSPIVVQLSAFVARHELTIVPADQINFGNVVFGETVTPHTVTITNTGNITATVNSVVLSGTHAGDFRLANHPTTVNPIAPGGSKTFTVYHTPVAGGFGARTAQITITDDVPTTGVVVAAGTSGINAENSVSFNVEVKNSIGETVLQAQTTNVGSIDVANTGQATRQTIIALSSNVLRRDISVEPMDVDFGDVEVGVAAETKTVTIRNTGTAELTIETILLGGVNSSEFTLRGLPTLPLHLAPNATREFSVDHTAASIGLKSATITITDNVPGTGAITVTLRSDARVVSEDDIVELPTVTELRGNFPNPFNPETTIVFALAKESPVTIEIINVRGQRVRTLVNQQHYGVGEHRIVWDGRDENGSAVASGMYFYRMVANDFSAMNRMILMK